MSEQPSAERITCACWKPEQDDIWSEWRADHRDWWVAGTYQGRIYWDLPRGAHCPICGAHLYRPGEDPTNPLPHAGPSNAELARCLQKRRATMKRVVQRLQREVAVLERALRLSSEKHGPHQLRAYGEAGERQYHERVAEDVARCIVEARRQLEGEGHVPPVRPGA